MKEWSKKEDRHYALHGGGLINITNRLDSLVADVIAEISDDQWKKIDQFSYLMEQGAAFTRKWGVEPKGYNFDYEITFQEDLEDDENFARYIIAHEFAHIVLGHVDDPLPCDPDDHLSSRALGQEKEADELAEKWGFPKTIKRRSQ
jgi:hypothetical protein